MYGLVQEWLDGLEPQAPLSGHLLAVQRDLRVPDLRILPLLQRRVALPQRPAEPQPVLQKGWFHVEHSPVQPAPTLPRGALHQPVHLRIDYLHEECSRQFRQAADILAVQARCIRLIPAVLESDAVRRLQRSGRTAAGWPPPREMSWSVCRVRNDRPRPTRKIGLEDGCLAGPIGPVDQIQRADQNSSAASLRLRTP